MNGLFKICSFLNPISGKAFVRVRTAVLLVSFGIVLSACQGGIDSMFPKAEVPIPQHLMVKMKAKGMKPNSPILMRIYKSESVLEVWKQKDTGRYGLLQTYEICKWSGKVGPKFKEGDRQAPEGFYRVGKAQLNPKSDYHLSFNIGYPNTFDRSHGRTGSHLMVHGACSSAGCYSMTDELVEEIYALARDAIKGGQDYFQVQAYPFRMTAKNLAKHAANRHFEFWKMLKEGSDLFELTNYPPKVDVCEKRYVFNRVADDDKPFNSRSQCPSVTMPGSLLTAWKKHLETEKVEFKKALKRNKLLGTFKDTALASVDVETISMMAKGSEVLPPPTPVKKPDLDPVPSEETAPALASSETGDTENQSDVVSAAENEAVLAGKPVPGEATREPAIVAPQAGTGQVENQAATMTNEQPPADNVVRAIPVPARAPRDSEQTGKSGQSASTVSVAPKKPAKKRPWWIRKTKDENPVSLIQPSQ